MQTLDQRPARNAFVSPEGKVAVGEIFYDSWGYNMTIVDFYKVVRLTPKGAEFVGLGQSATATGYLSGTTVPTEATTSRHGILKAKSWGSETAITFSGTMKNLYGKDDSNSRRVYLSKWDGKPKHFNHCD